MSLVNRDPSLLEIASFKKVGSGMLSLKQGHTCMVLF